MQHLEDKIEAAWGRGAELANDDIEAVRLCIDLLDRGDVRVAEVVDGEVKVHGWLKKAILLFFKIADMRSGDHGVAEFSDKVPLKTDLSGAGVRAVPGAIIRKGSFVAPGVVVMPAFINIGAHVGADTMVDTWATVGSCAQIGERVHLSGGVGIGGVLEPPMAAPVMVGDDAFIGSRSMVTNGAVVGAGAVLGSGVILNDSVPVIDASTGDELSRGVVPPWSVAVFATRPRTYGGGTFGLPCALVIKRIPTGERHDKAKLNEFLRRQNVAL